MWQGSHLWPKTEEIPYSAGQKYLWLVGFYGISTFVGYLTPNPFLSKILLFQTIQFSISTQFKCEKHFYFKLFSLVKQLYS